MKIDIFKDINKLRPLLTKQDKWKFVILLILMFFGALLEAAGVGAIPIFVSFIMQPSSLAENRWVGDLFNGLPDKASVDLVFWASALLFGFIIVKSIFLIFVNYVQARIVASQRLKIGDRLFRTYQSAPYEFHLLRSTSEFQRNIQNDTTQVLNGVIMPLLTLIMQLTMAISIITVMILNTPRVVSISLLITGMGVYFVILIFHKRLKHIGEVNRHEVKEMFKAIQQGFGALVDARIIGCEDYLNKIHRSSLAQICKAQRHQVTIQSSTSYMLEIIAILGLLIVLVLLVKTSESLDSILPIIVLLAVATTRLKQQASQIAGAINKINAARAYIPGIINDLRELDAISEQQFQTKVSGNFEFDNFELLRLENVNYSYPETTGHAIQDISLKLKCGESIAFIGATGCGKSTLINLILGLLKPKSGQITVNECDIHQNIQSWQTCLGYIPQSIYLIDDTIRANIAFGISQNNINENQLLLALHSAKLDDFVMTLPNGLDTIVGEHGVRLSGGQRQRLGIARALYFNPKVLVMDEATSALDNKTERDVMQAITNMKKGRTLIMIAHRLSTVKDCDRLYFLREGKLDSFGTYNELKQVSSAFRKMVMGNEQELAPLDI